MNRGSCYACGLLVCTILLGLLDSSRLVHGQTNRPNIVYILADDMGFGDIRSYNAASPVNTPNIDRIANAGMRFDNAHSSSSVCSPTRYSILTGRYAWRTSLQLGVVGPHAPGLIEPSRLTVGEMLQDSGYSTAAIGKWHLGMNWVTTNGAAPLSNGTNVNYTQPFTNGPTAHGFDSYVGDDIINWPPYTWIRNDRTVGSDLQTPAVPVGSTGNNTNPFVPPGGNLPGLVTPGYNTRDVMPTITNEAVSYIGTHAAQANPFFLYFPITAPHEPIFPPAFLDGASGVTGPKKAYGDFIATVDWAVGRVLDALEDPNGDENTSDSIVGDTLIVFTADNGAEGHLAFSTSAGSINGVPLRGDKHMIYEGGHRVPLIAQWNNQIQAGSQNHQLTELNDFMATVADIIDYDLPQGAAPDSVSIAPQLLGETSAPARNRGVQHSVSGAFAFRQVDEQGTEWKLIFTSGDGVTGVGQVHPNQPITNFSQLQLYNITTDPGEQINLVSGGGTPVMQQRALAMQSVLQQFIASGHSILPNTGDFNGDRIANAADYGVWRATFGSTTNLAADANGNNVVDAADYVFWRKAMASSGSGAGTASPGGLLAVPEPSTAIILAVATIGWLFCRRRRGPALWCLY